MRKALFVASALAMSFAAGAAELKVLSAAAVSGPATEVAAQFTRETGHRVSFEFVTAGQVDEKLAAGARPDIVINVRERIAAQTRAATKEAGVRDLGTVKVGVAVRAGAPRPDLSGTAAFRETLLHAQSIAYTNPARGGTVGNHFAKVIDDLGLRAALGGKVVLAADGRDVVRRVASGEVELGVTQVSEILHVAATTYAGPLPEALNSATTYTAWIPDPANMTARMLVDAMTTAAGREHFRAAGFDGAGAVDPVLAPTGTLRAAYIVSNVAQARLDSGTGSITGVAADIARELARRAGVPGTIAPLLTAAAVLEAVRSGAADIGFVAPNPRRTGVVLYSQAYMLVQQSALVRADSPLHSVRELDPPGQIIGINTDDSVGVWLKERLTAAQLRATPDYTLRDAAQWLQDGTVVAFAGGRQRLASGTKNIQGLRMLDDNFYGVP